MKKKIKSIDITIPPVKLYLEDIKLIEDVYKSNSCSYVIETDDYELDSSDDLLQIHPKIIKHLIFRSTTIRTKIEVTLNPRYASLYSSKSDTVSIGMINQIKDILVKRERFIPKFVTTKSGTAWISLVGFYLLILLFRLLLPTTLTNALFSITLNIFLLLLVGLFLFYAFYILGIGNYSVILLTSRQTKNRNMDWGLAISLISTIITLLTLVVTLAGKETRCFLKLDSCPNPVQESTNKKILK